MTKEINAAQADETAPIDGAATEATEATAALDTEKTSETPQVIEIDDNQKAINKLAFEKREAKRQAKALEEEVAALKLQIPAVPAQQPAPVMPKEDDFEYGSGEYQTALQKYNSELVNSQVQTALSAQQKQAEQAQEVNKRNERHSSFDAKVSESGIENFYEETSKLPQFDQTTLDAIMQTDNGVKVAYYLSQHLDQADAIAMNDPISAAMKIGEISARLSSATTTKKPSAAPDPVEPINQAGAVVGDGDSPLIKGATFT